jgi:hypothetical protein
MNGNTRATIGRAKRPRTGPVRPARATGEVVEYDAGFPNPFHRLRGS